MKYSTHQSWHVKLTYGVEGNKISGLQVHVKFEIETSILQLCPKN